MCLTPRAWYSRVASWTEPSAAWHCTSARVSWKLCGDASRPTCRYAAADSSGPYGARRTPLPFANQSETGRPTRTSAASSGSMSPWCRSRSSSSADSGRWRTYIPIHSAAALDRSSALHAADAPQPTSHSRVQIARRSPSSVGGAPSAAAAAAAAAAAGAARIRSQRSAAAAGGSTARWADTSR